MTDAAPDFDAMFADLCNQVGFCLHEKGQKKVIAALPDDAAAMKAAMTRGLWLWLQAVAVPVGVPSARIVSFSVARAPLVVKV